MEYSTNFTLIHKNSGEKFTHFPTYTKLDGIYGFLVFIPDAGKVYFFSERWNGIAYEDLTDQFDINQ